MANINERAWAKHKAAIADKNSGKAAAEAAAKAKAEADRAREIISQQQQGLDRGIAQGAKIYDEGNSQARIDEERAKRSTDVLDIISQRREAAKGLSSEVNAARVDSAQKANAMDTVGALRQTRGALSGAGVRGGAAGGALGNVAAQGAAKMADVKRQYVLDNVAAQTAGLNAFEQSVLGQEGIERQALAGRMKAQFAFGDLGQQSATLPFVLQGNEKAADAQAKAASGGMSVICTELHRQGIMPDDIYAADTFYGAMCIDEQTLRGYRFLASPVARQMSKSKLLTSIVAPLAMSWANNMAHFVGLPGTQRNWLGAAIGLVGELLCHAVGHFVAKKPEAIRARI